MAPITRRAAAAAKAERRRAAAVGRPIPAPVHQVRLRSFNIRQLKIDADVKQLRKTMKKTWPISRGRRVSRASRGMYRNGFSCYQLTGLQGILHQPLMMAWINTHNNRLDDGTVENPCSDPGIISDYKGNETELESCLACDMKRLIAYYWSEQNFDANGNPLPIHHYDPIIAPLNRFGRILNGPYQADPAEFQDSLLNWCVRCTGQRTPFFESTYDSLYLLRLQTTMQCSVCAPMRQTAADPTHTMVINPWMDSVEDALAENFTPEHRADYRCDSCDRRGTTTVLQRIIGGPEILRLSVGVFELGGYKVRNPITIPKNLDLTGFQANTGAELKYRLSSVLWHQGGCVEEGHWCVAAQGPQRPYEMDDHRVTALTERELRDNPRDPGEDEFNAFLVTYIRQHTKTLPAKELANLRWDLRYPGDAPQGGDDANA